MQWTLIVYYLSGFSNSILIDDLSELQEFIELYNPDSVEKFELVPIR